MNFYLKYFIDMMSVAVDVHCYGKHKLYRLCTIQSVFWFYYCPWATAGQKMKNHDAIWVSMERYLLGILARPKINCRDFKKNASLIQDFKDWQSFCTKINKALTVVNQPIFTQDNNVPGELILALIILTNVKYRAKRP